MPADDIQVKQIPAIRAAELTAPAASLEPASITPVIQTLARWIDENGYRSTGYPRELTLEYSDDPDKWVTELQEPITPA